LYTNRGEGEAPALISVENENMQSRIIVQRVLELREEGVPLKEIAVLFRAGYHSFDLEIELAKANIPYVKFGGLKLMETAHIKDMIAHLRVLENPKDIIAWTRILLLVEGIGSASAERITDEILRGLNLRHQSSDERVSGLVRNKNVFSLFEILREIAGDKLSIADKCTRLLEYYLPILRVKYDDHPKRVKDLEMFLTIAERYHSLAALLTDMALEPPNQSVETMVPEGRQDEYLTLSTIHSAKGLEWHSVFVMHLVDGRFPITSAAESFEALEEERRLFYVACTRAKQNLILLYPTNIFDRAFSIVLSKKSRFLDGVPEKLLEEYVVELDE
jgi:DNA helicase-2/ATP-dependent DNA helicase PcrA